jgi:hypothetical protein
VYGERGLVAFEIKRSARVRPDDLRGLQRFRADFPKARAYLVNLGPRRWHESGIDVLPFEEAVRTLDELL